jgi:hypothetical protein
MPYAKMLCRNCDLRNVEVEKHMFLVCSNTQKVGERFYSTLPFSHTNTLVELMQIMNTVALAKFVAYYQY